MYTMGGAAAGGGCMAGVTSVLECSGNSLGQRAMIGGMYGGLIGGACGGSMHAIKERAEQQSSASSDE